MESISTESDGILIFANRDHPDSSHDNLSCKQEASAADIDIFTSHGVKGRLEYLQRKPNFFYFSCGRMIQDRLVSASDTSSPLGHCRNAPPP